MNILKEESKSQYSDDEKCIEKFNEYFTHNPEYVTYKQANSINFGISHSSGKVKYDATKILTKSRDYLCKSIVECLQKSGDNFVSDLFMTLPAPNGSFSKYKKCYYV